jgi:hypothetical protein
MFEEELRVPFGAPLDSSSGLEVGGTGERYQALLSLVV